MSTSWRLSSFLVLGFLVSACGSPDGDRRTNETTPAEPAPSGPVELPTCGVGKMISNATGGAECVDVGPSEVPGGFERVKDVWGFKAINGWGGCPLRFYSAIGRRDCEGIDLPCSADFAPPGATVVHGQAELLAALAARRSGATIALAEGTYAPIVIDHDVKLVGQCPEKTVLRGTGGKSHAIEIRGSHSVSIRSLSIREAGFALWASDGAAIEVTRSLLSNNECGAWIERGAKLDFRHSLVEAGDVKMGDGIIVARGGHAALENMEFRDMHVALQVFGAGSTAKGSSLVMKDRSPEPLSALVVAAHGGDIDIDRSLIFAEKTFIGGARGGDPREDGVLPAHLRVTSSEVLRVHPTDAGGFDVSDGSRLELVNDTFETRARVAVSAEKGAKVSVERTVIRPVLPTDTADWGVGAGFIINDDVQLDLDRTAIMGVVQSAIMASRGCHVRVSGSLVQDVWEFERKDYGKRFGTGQAISLSGDAALELTDSTLLDNAGASIWMDRGNEASVKVERSVIAVTREPERSTATVGLLAWSGTVDLRDSLVHGMPSSLAFGDATGAVFGTTLSRGDVGFRFLGQSRAAAAAQADQRPSDGEILTRGNVLVETATVQSEEALALGDCRCTKDPRGEPSAR
jgi:hypothetical protein